MLPMKFGVVVFPDLIRQRRPSRYQERGRRFPENIWHGDTDLPALMPLCFRAFMTTFDAGRWLDSPVMKSIVDFAEKGKLVIGICNGFQVLLEAGLLPGAMLSNDVLEFRCGWVNLKVENNSTAFTNLYKPKEIIRMPIAHHEGNYYAEPEVLDELERAGRVVLRYVDEAGIPKRGQPDSAAGILQVS